MTKKISLILGIGILCCNLLTGCQMNETIQSQNDTATINDVLELVYEKGDFQEYRDRITGVHYFFYEEYTYRGYGCTLCPRYNADGTLYID